MYSLTVLHIERERERESPTTQVSVQTHKSRASHQTVFGSWPRTLGRHQPQATSHYHRSRLADEYDAVVYVDRTSALVPLDDDEGAWAASHAQHPAPCRLVRALTDFPAYAAD